MLSIRTKYAALVLCGAICGVSGNRALAAAEAAPSADLILRNARIYTVDERHPTASAVAIKDGKFIGVGSDADVAKFRAANTREEDLAGQFVVPGFIDSHTHIHGGGQYVTGVQLRDAKTLAEVQRRVAAYAKAHPEKKWILGEAWSYGYPDMPKGEPTRQMLDAVVSDRPVMLGSGMAHAGWANSKALEMAGITASTPDPVGGVFVRDARGAPTGWEKEAAWQVLRAKVPAETIEETREIMQGAMNEAAKLGVTRLVSCGGDWETLPVLSEWEKQGKLLTRFSISAWASPNSIDDQFAQLVADGRSSYHSDWLEAKAVKFVEDGVIESHTAYMPEGYADHRSEKGMSFWDADKQKAGVIKLARMGVQVYTHAIGDGAIRQTLDAYEAAEKNGAPSDWRPRIEHYEAPFPADIQRLVRLHAIASMQPAMIYPKDQWMGMEGLWQKYAGDERTKVGFPTHSVLALKGHLAFGTDWPVTDLNPLLGVRNAVLRQSYDGEPNSGWVAAEKISIDESIRAYTLGSAYAAHREKIEGSIEVGKLADLVVLSEDITHIAPNRIQHVKVRRTIVGGKTVYESH